MPRSTCFHELPRPPGSGCQVSWATCFTRKGPLRNSAWIVLLTFLGVLQMAGGYPPVLSGVYGAELDSSLGDLLFL